MKTAEMSTADLERRRDELQMDIVSIKTQIYDAKSHAALTGEYSDRDWFGKASHALRMKGAEHQLILTELSRRKKQERQSKGTSFEQRFIQIARRRLDPDLFRELMEEAES